MTPNDFFATASQFPLTEKMPVLFLGHGSPMNAIEENQFVTGFRNIAKTLPKPNAIVCISAHWYTKGTKVTAMNFPPTIHDFGGFPKALFEVQYPAVGNPELASFAKELLQPTPVELDHDWGLDHGAWSVLLHLFPKADIPVIQLSIDYTKEATYHFELAKQLQNLRERGVLIVGSGNIIHNLRLVDFANINMVDYGYDWAIEAHQKVNQWLENRDFMSIVDYEKQGKALQLAVPTPDHYLPLIYILGLQKGTEDMTIFNNHLLAGSLSMTSIKFG